MFWLWRRAWFSSSVCFCLAKRLPRFVIACDLSQQQDQRLLVGFVAVLFLLGNLALIVAVDLEISCVDSYAGAFALSVLLRLAGAVRRWRHALADKGAASMALKVAMVALVACFCLYFASEISNQLFCWPPF